jgi:hypothetical protein
MGVKQMGYIIMVVLGIFFIIGFGRFIIEVFKGILILCPTVVCIVSWMSWNVWLIVVSTIVAIFFYVSYIKRKIR